MFLYHLLHPGVHLHRVHLQDKLRQKQFFAAAGVPVADFRGVESDGDMAAAAAEFGFPFMLKSRM